jgi:ribose/xylose/arabinose/galactoside ABC-type transport system permease subunit
MKEIKIVPFVLSILGLITCGIAIGFATKDLTTGFSVESFIMVIGALFLFLCFLLLSIGAFSGKNKFTW